MHIVVFPFSGEQVCTTVRITKHLEKVRLGCKTVGAASATFPSKGVLLLHHSSHLYLTQRFSRSREIIFGLIKQCLLSQADGVTVELMNEID